MIRPIETGDIAAITAIYNYYITETVVSFEEVPLTPADMQERVERVLASGLCWLVAVDAGEVIGYAYANEWKARAAYRYSVEVSVYLSRTHKARGWGTHLYQALFAMLVQRSVHVVIGGIALPNPASIALHEKFGMDKVAHFREVGNKSGKWIDVGYWQKELAGQPATPA